MDGESQGVPLELGLPSIVTFTEKVRDVRSWATTNADRLHDLLRTYGAVLFRGFPIGTPDEFEAFALVLSGERPVRYREAATPRTRVTGNTFTSTEYPADRIIFAHNENSHTLTWPGKLFFYCERPPESGGETPLTDCRAVYERIEAGVRDRFVREGWLYRRYFSPRGRFDWRNVFDVASRRDAMDYFERNGLVGQFNGDDELVVWYHRWAAVEHPETHDQIWFNHGTFFNEWNLEPELREFATELGSARLPYNTFYGGGEPVTSEVIAHLRAAYLAETSLFSWRRGDVLMIDNVRVAHGRRAFTGDRRVLVTMTEQMAADTPLNTVSATGGVRVNTRPVATVPNRLPAS